LGFFDNRGRDRDDLGPPPDPFRFDHEEDYQSPIPLRWIGIVAGLLVLFVTLNVLKSAYVDWLWFDSVGPDGESSYLSVYRKVLTARATLFFAGAIVAAIAIGANIWFARRLAPRGIEESFIEEVDPQAIRRIVDIALVAGTIFMATIFGVTAAGAWETVFTYLNGVAFGVEETVFNRDISFYLFELPALHFVQGWVLALLIVSLLGAGAVYGLTLSLQRFELNITHGMRVHLSIVVGLILLVIAIGTYLSLFDLVTEPGGYVFGATYTDVNARMPVRYLLVVLGIFAGLATMVNGFISQNYRLPTFALGLWAIAGVIGGAVFPQAIQSLQVEPNELEKEREFIQRNIRFTRMAWGLDRVEETQFPAAGAVTAEEIDANPDTVDNIRILDARPLLDTINQVQSIRPLYQFTDVDIDRYTLDGRIRQLLLAPRELDIQRVDNGSWTQERLQFTHGFGAVVAPVNEATAEGLPNLMTRGIPPQGDEVPISEEGARLYFGELTRHYVIVNTNVAEFDYPLGDANAETRYEADRGIRLSSLLRRAALAWHLNDTNLLISGQIGEGSRVLLDRTLAQRISKLAPFLLLDADPYIVALDGRLVWIQDAYTYSGAFPYSQPRGGVNYIRNSVKIVVDAYTGDTTFYTVEEDPVVQTWARIFPDLFTPGDQMPTELRAHLRYPESMFRLQADLYTRYHITDPTVFYLGEDVWNIPSERFGSADQLLEPYYLVMTLPGEEEPEFVLVLPFTPRNKQNTVAWLAGRSDGEFYGLLRSFRFPTDDLVFGPAQVEARIDQDPVISQQISLWNQSGSEVIRGNLLMIPIGESFLFVEPLYLQAQNSRIPELKRVVVANGNAIAMEPTLERSIDVIFGRRAPTGLEVEVPGVGVPTPGATATPAPTQEPPPPPTATPETPGGTATPPPLPPGTLEALLQQAREASDAAQAELDRLRDIIEQIEELEPASP